MKLEIGSFVVNQQLWPVYRVDEEKPKFDLMHPVFALTKKEMSDLLETKYQELKQKGETIE